MRVTQDMIDPELRAPAKLFRLLFGKGQSSEAQVRRFKTPLAMRVVGRLPVPGVSVVDRHVVRPDGTELPLIVATRSKSAGSARPGILWIHGGGYSIGTARGELMVIKQLLGLTDAVFVSPDYRLSTEAPYPAAFDDCYLALLWLKEHAAELGVRTDQIIVAGGSAGGGLTAAVTIHARNEGKVNVAFQMPLYPMIEDRGTPSSKDNDAPLYDGTTNESGWRVYLGDLYGGEVPPTAAPARETDYRGLPPTITLVGGIEPFRDETVAYVENLRLAGVPVSFREFAGAWHAFDGLAPRAKVSKEARAWKEQQFTDFLQKYFAAQA